ncbi:hypothetical protein PIB30_099956, partial [Stylosanthes scabra]|nr:hypothetical protein [Stylosanthes scabra]
WASLFPSLGVQVNPQFSIPDLRCLISCRIGSISQMSLLDFNASISCWLSDSKRTCFIPRLLAKIRASPNAVVSATRLDIAEKTDVVPPLTLPVWSLMTVADASLLVVA